MRSPQPQSSPWCILLLRHERSPVPSLLGIWKYNKNSPSCLEILLREAVTQGWSYAGEFFSENFSCPFQPSELSRQALHLKSGSSSCTATCSERQCLGHVKGESVPLWGSDTPLSSVPLIWPSTLHGYQETRGAAFVKTSSEQGWSLASGGAGTEPSQPESCWSGSAPCMARGWSLIPEASKAAWRGHCHPSGVADHENIGFCLQRRKLFLTSSLRKRANRRHCKGTRWENLAQMTQGLPGKLDPDMGATQGPGSVCNHHR